MMQFWPVRYKIKPGKKKKWLDWCNEPMRREEPRVLFYTTDRLVENVWSLSKFTLIHIMLLEQGPRSSHTPLVHVRKPAVSGMSERSVFRTPRAVL